MAVEIELTEFEFNLKQLTLQNLNTQHERARENLLNVEIELRAELQGLKEEKPTSRKRIAELQLSLNNLKAFNNAVKEALSQKITNGLQLEAIKSGILKRFKKIKGEFQALGLVNSETVHITGEHPLFLNK